MTEQEFRAFKYEIENWGNIPISSQNCGIGCRFCKVSKDPILKRFPKIPKITTEDLYKGFKFINDSHNYVRLGAGVFVAPHTDPFLHPEIYNFIKIASEYFPNKRIRTVTTGSYIDEKKVEYLNTIKNFGIDLSLITMQKQREYIVPRATRKRIEFLLQNAPLKKISLMFTGSFDDLKADIEMLLDLDWHIKGQEILVRRIENTDLSQGELFNISKNSIDSYVECINFLKKNYTMVKFTVPFLSDEYRGGDNEYFIDADKRINKIKIKLKENEFKKFGIILPESSFNYFKNRLNIYENVDFFLIKNKLYGGSVTVAGLLNHKDIFEQLQLKNRLDILILPFEMYDTDKNEITGENIKVLEKRLNVKAWTM
jgi:hypothetical protein